MADGQQVQILYEDNDIIVVVKPAGMASQEEHSSDMDMVSWLKNYLYRERNVKNEPYIGVVHRLDRPVGGIMVYAKTPQAAADLSDQFRPGPDLNAKAGKKDTGKGKKGRYAADSGGTGNGSREVIKEYIAVLTGTLKQKEGKLTDYLVEDRKTNMTGVAGPDAKGAKEAVLEYKVRRTKYEEGKQYSLVNIHLITGRHHQIRIQMAHAGAGLWGDTKYNPEFAGKEGWYDLALFEWHLEFDHPKSRKHLVFQVPAPDVITSHFDII